MADNAKVSRVSKRVRSIVKFFKEIRTELRKVVWLSWKQLRINTITVIVACITVGALIWVLDFILRRVVSLVLT